MLADLDFLRTRAAVVARVRSFLCERGSVEVETPAIVLSPGVDAWLDPIAVQLTPAAGAEAVTRYLATSPEYHMKRLVAAGSGPIHQLAKAWRDGEAGRQHEPEFTLLEWYRPDVDDAGLMDETEDLVRCLAAEFSGGALQHRGTPVDTTAPFERVPFHEVFERHTGMDADTADDRSLGRLLRAGGHRPPRDSDREALFDLVLALVVQPRLGSAVPTFVTDWPADRAALARLRERNGRTVAGRFELYAAGVELCNGYHELRGADLQRARIDEENTRRAAIGKVELPVDEAFVAAVDALPPCAGNALGFDRLLMLLFGRDDIGGVRAFRLG